MMEGIHKQEEPILNVFLWRERRDNPLNEWHPPLRNIRPQSRPLKWTDNLPVQHPQLCLREDDEKVFPPSMQTHATSLLSWGGYLCIVCLCIFSLLKGTLQTFWRIPTWQAYSLSRGDVFCYVSLDPWPRYNAPFPCWHWAWVPKPPGPLLPGHPCSLFLPPRLLPRFQVRFRLPWESDLLILILPQGWAWHCIFFREKAILRLFVDIKDNILQQDLPAALGFLSESAGPGVMEA